MKPEITSNVLASLIFVSDNNYKNNIIQYNIDISNKYLLELIIKNLLYSIKFREEKILKDHCEYK